MHRAQGILSPFNTLLRLSARIAEEGRSMKRIAAIITLSVGVIAIPVTAIAATSGSGSSKPTAQTCTDGTVTFDMPPNKSHTFTEVSGPDMYAGESFVYDATTYTVATVSGAAFTLELNGQGYRHKGPSVVDGNASLSCATGASK
jgi:hypothetical protein